MYLALAQIQNTTFDVSFKSHLNDYYLEITLDVKLKINM